MKATAQRAQTLHTWIPNFVDGFHVRAALTVMRINAVATYTKDAQGSLKTCIRAVALLVKAER